MSALVMVIGIIIAKFSWNYLQGDTYKAKFYSTLLLLQALVLLLVHADNIFLFSGLLLLSNLLLVIMLYHNTFWSAAYHSARIALQYLVSGCLLQVIGFILLYIETGISSFSQIYTIPISYNWIVYVALGCITGSAMLQSAVMPMHRWLLNSLNAPTPVSACMHAGLINAGVLLLVRCAPLYLNNVIMLYVLFIIGVITATFGVAYKLIQPNIKRMLVCSTIAQMGFVFVQCGLGFFTAAIAHVFWHGMFKAYLFLTSPMIERQRDSNAVSLHYGSFFIGLMSGFISAVGFSVIQGFSQVFTTTTLGLLLVVFIAGMQLALTILQSAVYDDLIIVFIASLSLGIMYGLFDMMIHYPLEGLHAMQAQPLTTVHAIGFSLLFIPWICMLLYNHIKPKPWFKKIYAYIYVYLIRHTKADIATTTLHRNHYRYK
tara:strand:+ start:1822 stop:3111 length:1290 start_codon:yes stop_codon:yes gene_type:complete